MSASATQGGHKERTW